MQRNKARLAGIALGVGLLLGGASSMSIAAGASAGHAYAPHLRPVSRIAETMIAIPSNGAAAEQDKPDGAAMLPVYLSRDWTKPQPDVVRAIIVIHGKLRNADRYFETAQTAEREAAKGGANVAGTILIAPQFLATIDFGMRALPDNVLRWDANGWMAGEAAVAPRPISSYSALDAIIARLADRTRFPALREVAIVGHSGGAQVVQRYAIAAHDLGVLATEHIDVRYVVSSPSSYAYFNKERPTANHGFGPFEASACPGYDDWKYGMSRRPAYLADRSLAQLEATYASRHVFYLVGGNDDDPAQAALDRSCSAEAQGSERVARATAYFAYMQARHPQGLTQSLHIVPGVGHNGARMLTSVCAIDAMYDTGECR